MTTNDDEPKLDTTSQAETLQRLASLGELAAGMVHQARNLMTGVLTFSQLGKRRAGQGDDDAKAGELFAQIETETMACLELFDGILRASRNTSSSGASELPLTLCDPAALTRTAVRLTQNHLRIHNRKLDVAIDDGLPPVETDRDIVVQALLNLIINAMHASPDGGTVHVAAARDGDSAKISVADQGDGVPDDLRTKIFEPFFTTKPAGVGTGLGLSTSRKQLQQCGGDLTLESGSGKGAVFSITLGVRPT